MSGGQKNWKKKKKKSYSFPLHIMQIYLCVLITNLLQMNLYNKSVRADIEFCWRAVFRQT